MRSTSKKNVWLAATGLTLAVSTAFLPASAQAQAESEEGSTPPSSYSLSYDATVASRYLFQGLDYSDGRAVVQPNLSATFSKFSFGVWGNVQPNIEALNEIDLTVKYTHEAARWTVSPGYMLLRYPNRDWDPSQELFVDLAWTAPIHPTLSVHYDFDAGRGTYATLGVSREVKAPLTLAANLFYQNQYYEMTGCPAMEFKASASFAAGPVTIAPSLSHFATWTNGDFTDAAAVPSTWLFAVNVAHQVH